MVVHFEAKVASEDYPELEQILIERPPLERQGTLVDSEDPKQNQGPPPMCPICGIRPATTTAMGSDCCEYCSKNKFGIPSTNQDPPQFGEYTSNSKYASVDSVTPVGANNGPTHALTRGGYPGKSGIRYDSICGVSDLNVGIPEYHPHAEVTDHVTCKKCLDKLTPKTSSLDDPEFKFHFTSSWKDVRAKATRMRKEGNVHIISSPSTVNPYIIAEVVGDTNTYQTTLLRSIGGKSVGGWECSMPMGTLGI